MKQLSRRTVLRGAGGVALALPFLDAMRPQRAKAAGAVPRRVIFVFKPNGNEHGTRFKTVGETNYVLGEFLEPLEPYRNEMLLLNGVNKMFRNIPALERADDHQQGGAGLAPWRSGSGSFPIGGSDRSIGYVEGPSADFVLGSRVLEKHPTVAHRHLVYRVGGRGNNIWSVASHGGPVGKQNPVNPETDPYQAYARIFGSARFGNDQPDPAVLKRLAMQKSGLDLVLAEANSLRSKVGSGDRAKIDQHLQSLSDIERTLKSGTSTGSGAVCEPVMLGNKLDPYSDANHQIIGELFFKIGAMAFACDLTRVINFAWSGNTSGRVYNNLNIPEGHHDISHKSDAAAFALIRKINRHLWTQSTKLHETLKAIPEGDGTMWDNTLIVHWNELGQGDRHSTDNDLVVLTGGASGHFKMGRMLQFNATTQAPFSDILVNVFHYMGFDDVKVFGDPRLSKGGPVAGLTV